MSWATMGALPDEEVVVVVSGNNVQVTIGALPDETRLMLPHELARRIHAALGEALAATPDEGAAS